MAKPIKQCPAEIKVENLLRLKRFERPSDPFWNQFDRDLHQRMLQTLVKKDPWYVQLMRGFSGSLLPGTTLVLSAVVIGMLVVRPTFQSIPSNAVNLVPINAPVQVADVSLPFSIEAGSLIGTLDYDVDAISVEDVSDDVDFTRDFGLECIQVAAYDAAAYSADSPHARMSFVSTGVASLVY